MRAPCKLYDPKDPRVANRLHAQDTSVNGVGLQVHGQQPEAWHMGKPLFRCAEEWCDAEAGRREQAATGDAGRVHASSEGWSQACVAWSAREKRIEPTLEEEDVSHKTWNQVADGSQTAIPYSCAPASDKRQAVCCLWLEGKCGYNSDHVLHKTMYLHEDVPGMPCGFGDLCKYHHHKTRAVSADGAASRQAASQSKDVDQPSQPDAATLHVGMLAYFSTGNTAAWCEVLEISASPERAAAPVLVQHGVNKKHTRWLGANDLQIPDYSFFWQGMEVNVIRGDGIFSGKVRQVSKDAAKAAAPIQVRFNGRGPDEDEWVGADRLCTKALTYLQAKLPPSSSLTRTGGDEGSKPGAVTLEPGTVVYFVSRGSLTCAQVQQISASASRLAAPVQVCFGEADAETVWLPVEDLQVPDYSGLHEGLQVTVRSHGKLWDCKILQVLKGKCKAPVQVHYNGYGAEDDEWVGADRFRHKALQFAKAQLPESLPNTAESMSGLAGQVISDSQASNENKRSKNPGRAELQPGLVVLATSLTAMGEVLEISTEKTKAAAPVKVWLQSDEAAWFNAEDLQIPDYSAVTLGLRVGVTSGSTTFVATVEEISCDRPITPVRIRYSGYSSDSDEWVGADRLCSKALKFIQPSMPDMEAPTQTPKAASSSSALLQPGMAVCDATTLKCGEVLKISTEASRAGAPVKVRFHGTKTQSTWLAAEDLRMPDYSKLRVGLKLAVLSDGAQYDCKVLEISRSKDRFLAPVRVHYNGYADADDEWVGADRIYSKDLRLVEVVLQAHWKVVSGKSQESVQTSVPQLTEDRQGPSTGCYKAPGPFAMPWDEAEGSDEEEIAKGLDAAIAAVNFALVTDSLPAVQKRNLEKALRAAASTAHVRRVLAEHGWNGVDFDKAPDLQLLKQQLSVAKAELFEAGSMASHYSDTDESDAEELGPLFNDVASSCGAPEVMEARLDSNDFWQFCVLRTKSCHPVEATFEAELEAQPDNFETLTQLNLS